MSQGAKTALNIGISIIGMLGMIASDGAIGAYFSSAEGLGKAVGFGVMVGKNGIAMFAIGSVQGAVSGEDPVDSGLEAAGLNNYGKGFAQNFLGTLVWAGINIKGPGDPAEGLFKTMWQRKWTFMAQGPLSYLTSKGVGALYGDKFITKDDIAPLVMSLGSGFLWDGVTEYFSKGWGSKGFEIQKNYQSFRARFTASFGQALGHMAWGAVVNTTLAADSGIKNKHELLNDPSWWQSTLNGALDNSMMFSSIFSMQL